MEARVVFMEITSPGEVVSSGDLEEKVFKKVSKSFENDVEDMGRWTSLDYIRSISREIPHPNNNYNNVNLI